MKLLNQERKTRWRVTESLINKIVTVKALAWPLLGVVCDYVARFRLTKKYQNC